VDHHVEEQAARPRDVRERRRRGIAAGDAHEVRLADRAGGDGVAHGGVRRVEAPVEADLERDPGRLDGGERAVDLVEVERHRLLAQDRLARRRGGDDEIRVRGGARADGDGVDLRGGQHPVDARRHRDAEAVGHLARRGLRDVVDGRHVRAGDPLLDDPRVHAADAPGAEEPDPERPCWLCPRVHRRAWSPMPGADASGPPSGAW
jgi:hypothetical protein